LVQEQVSVPASQEYNSRAIKTKGNQSHIFMDLLAVHEDVAVNEPPLQLDS
jgi:hypothetical protein